MIKNKRTSKNDFIYNYDTKHMNYVFEEDGKKYHALGITHDKRTFGKNNMPLNKNPQKGKSDKSYIRNGIVTNKISSFAKHSDPRFSFSKDDYNKVKSKIRKYKSNRRHK